MRDHCNERNQSTGAIICRFTRLEYDPIFGPRDTPRHVDRGELRYVAPDQLLLQIFGERAERWAWDGRFLYVSDERRREVIKHTLPAELQGKPIAPLGGPFWLAALLGSSVDRFKEQVYARITTPPDAKSQVRLEAFPKTASAALWFRRVDVILSQPDMLPEAVQIHSTNGSSRTVYTVRSLVAADPKRVTKEIAAARIPYGWTQRTLPAADTGQQADY